MGEDFTDRDLSGATFHDSSLDDSRFARVSFRRSRLRDVDLTDARISGAVLANVDIDGDIDALTVNGVDVGPLVEAELDRLYPERPALRPTDAAGYRAAWAIVEDLWAGTVERARRLDDDALHERVDGEWSFVETLRHLVFATDSWIRRGLLGDPAPWHPLGLPWDEMPDTPGVPRDREARPALETILAVRADRMAGVRDYLADLTDEQLAGRTQAVAGPGWPPPESFPVKKVLDVILDEEWWHRRFAERDLAVLQR